MQLIHREWKRDRSCPPLEKIAHLKGTEAWERKIKPVIDDPYVRALGLVGVTIFVTSGAFDDTVTELESELDDVLGLDDFDINEVPLPVGNILDYRTTIHDYSLEFELLNPSLLLDEDNSPSGAAIEYRIELRW